MSSGFLANATGEIGLIDWWTFGGLVLAGLVGVAAVVASRFDSVVSDGDVSIPVVLLNALVVNGALVALAVLVGLTLGADAGLGLVGPAGLRVDPLVVAGPLGVGVSVGIVALDRTVFPSSSRAGLARSTASNPDWRDGLLASLYGGVTEELLLRFGLLSLVLWLGWRALDPAVPRPPPIVAWLSIGVTALLFGVSHLPAAARDRTLSAVVVSRVVLLNAVGGVVFGWLFWQFGLVYAIASHYAADVVLHVLVPRFSDVE